MLEVRVLIQSGNDTPHEETLPVSSAENAKKEVEETIGRFNGSLGPYEKPRKLIKLIDTGVQLHDWHKVNLVTLHDSHSMYDLMECTACGLQVKARGISRPTATACHPERTCKQCHREYVSIKKYKRHRKKRHGAE